MKDDFKILTGETIAQAVERHHRQWQGEVDFEIAALEWCVDRDLKRLEELRQELQQLKWETDDEN